MKCCMNGGNVIRLLFLSVKLLKFEIQKCGQILCAHKPYFLMPGHIYPYVLGFNQFSALNLLSCGYVCVCVCACACMRVRPQSHK